MEVSELLEHDLGHGQVDDLDTAPPLALLAMLSQRSGIEPDRLRCMSFAGWVPWLLDSLDDQIPDALETYAFQLSVLLPKLRRRTRSITSWRTAAQPADTSRLPALSERPGKPSRTACMEAAPDAELPAAWLLAGILLGRAGRFLGWENADTAPRTASDAIAVMDRRTAGTDDRPCGAAAPTHPRWIVVSATTHAAR